MAAIEGLNEEQCQALAGVQVGDLVLVECYPKESEEEYDEHESGDESEDSQNDDEEAAGSGDDDEAEDDAESGAGNQADDEDEEAENEEDEEGADGEEEESDRAAAEAVDDITSTTLYKVHGVTKNDVGSVTDITVGTLDYCSKPAEATSSVYHIYGQDIILSTTPVDGSAETVTVKEVVVDTIDREYSITLKPNGDTTRSIIFNGRCPVQCNHGWVATQEDMHSMVTENITTLSPHSPVCPVCMGKALMQEFQSLRETFENLNVVDMGDIVEFYGRLNPRRRLLGYRFQQLDEREWGYMFDDMLSEDEGQGDQDDGQWETWEEAMDPNSGTTSNPASDAAIAALLRKSFADVEQTELDASCAVCREEFVGDTIIAELPCGHFFCDSGCAQVWLKHSNSCPKCRAKLPVIEDRDGEAEADGVAEVGAQSNTGNEAHDSGTEKAEETSSDDIEKDGEDVVMSDVD